MRASYLFTSESVSEGHPDKVCDRISDEIVDLFFREALAEGMDPWSVRCACETLATTNRVVIAGETRGPKSITHAKIEAVARAAIKDIGYEQSGFHWKNAKVEIYNALGQKVYEEIINGDGVAKTTHSQFLGIPLAYWGMFMYLLLAFLLVVDKLKKIKVNFAQPTPFLLVVQKQQLYWRFLQSANRPNSETWR